MYIAQLRDIIFQCWSSLTVNICFVISRNKCNKFVSSSMTQQHRIRIDLPNTAAVGPKIDANAWCHVVYTMFPWDMDHVIPCSPGTWRCTDETRHFLFLLITWRALDQSQSRNSDRAIKTVIIFYNAGAYSYRRRGGGANVNMQFPQLWLLVALCCCYI